MNCAGITPQFKELLNYLTHLWHIFKRKEHTGEFRYIKRLRRPKTRIISLSKKTPSQKLVRSTKSPQQSRICQSQHNEEKSSPE